MGEATGTFDLPESERKKARSPLRRAVTIGLVGGAALIYVSVTGIVERFHERNIVTGADGEGILQLSHTMLLIILLVAGYVAARLKREVRPGQEEASSGPESLGRGALAGLVATGLLALVVLLMELIINLGMNPREIVVPISPNLLDEILRFGQAEGATGFLLMLGLGAGFGALGAALQLLGERIRRPLFVALGTTLLISMIEPMLRPILSNRDIPNEWLYQRGGLTVLGVVIVFVLAGTLSLFLGWRKAAQPTEARPATRVRGELSTGEQAVRWIGLAGVAVSLVLVVTTFAGGELTNLAVFSAVALDAVALVMGVAMGRRARRAGFRPPSAVAIGGAAGAVGLFMILPPIAGPFVSDVMGTVGLYILLGLGLNIVVGYAGLLDLGYVAFFAVGAYSMAILTSRASFLVVETGGGVQNLQYAEQGFTNFWVALPIAVVVAVVSGILIGAPVLRLRGDYLAIVTLGFGEIIRTLVLSDWLAKWLGGAQGIIQIPAITPEALDLRDPERIYYIILIFALIAAFISFRLVESRVGRAWAAMREDESVAEAMGISVIKYKLLAFAMGAGIGSLGGVFFAAKIGSVFPGSFLLIVSINVLAVIVLGGMGSIPGVVVGAFVLVGLPEMLREFAEYRLLFYGAILMAIMIYKPEGLLPNVRRRQELHEKELEEAGADAGAPTIATTEKGDE